MYIYDSLGRGRVYAENEMVYGKVYYNSTKRISNGSACVLGPCQCIPGPVFRPRNFNKNRAWGMRLGKVTLCYSSTCTVQGLIRIDNFTKKKVTLKFLRYLIC